MDEVAAGKPRPNSGPEMDQAIALLQTAPTAEMRRDAAIVLADYSGERAFGALVDATKHDREWIVRRCAADALGGYGEMAVEPLVSVLDDPEETVVEHAAKSLGTIRNKRAAGPLIRTLGYKSDYAPVRAARDALIAFGSDVVPELLAHIGDTDLHAMIVETLAAIGDIRAAGVLLSVATDAKEKTHIRAHAIRGLGKVSGFDSGSALLEMLADADDHKLVAALAQTLTKLLPHFDIDSATREAKRRGLTKHLAGLKSIAPGMPEDVARSLSGAHSYFQSGANLVCNTKFGNFQLIVGGGRVLDTVSLRNVIENVETALGEIA